MVVGAQCGHCTKQRRTCLNGSRTHIPKCNVCKTKSRLHRDFYLPEQNILIEYDGEQHFHEVRNDRYGYQGIVARDNYKNQWCKENNIRLIRIPYTEYNNIDGNYLKTIIEENK